MAGFTKLFSGIVASTIWREAPHVKIVWITMLALADRNGAVSASVPGLADLARVPVDQARDALARLEAPDPDSRTKEHEGRRIEPCDGGWRLLNYVKYRELRNADERRIQTREAVRRYRQRHVSDVSTSKQGKPKQKQKQKQKQETVPPSEGAVNWLSPYLSTYTKAVGKAKPGLIADAVSAPHKELGPDAALALWTRWCSSGKSDYGPAWFGQHWRKAANGKGATQQQRNFAVLDKVEAEEHGKP